VIPARAGSKSIPNKNLIRIGTKRLIDYTIESALRANIFDRVLVTTDIEDLLDTDFPNTITSYRRDSELCSDEALMLDVVRDIIISKNISPKDYVWLLQPTTPFRREEDFTNIYDKMATAIKRYEKLLVLRPTMSPPSLISVVNVGAQSPYRMYAIKENKEDLLLRIADPTTKGQSPMKTLMPLRLTNFDNKQELLPSYIRNGAFYVFNVAAFMERSTFHIRPCLPHIMPEVNSINIDGHLDALLAGAVVDAGLV